MICERLTNARRATAKLLGAAFIVAAMCAIPASAQYQDRGPDRAYDRLTTIQPGTLVPVRTNETIDVERRDNQVYYGVVDQDVRGDDGRLAIPRGSTVELFVRVEPDNDLIIDLESVTVNGDRYAMRTQPNRAQSQSARDGDFVGAIIGALQGGQVRGRTIRIPRDSVMTFRVTRPLDVGVADRGVMRNGRHYHDWYNNN